MTENTYLVALSGQDLTTGAPVQFSDVIFLGNTMLFTPPSVLTFATTGTYLFTWTVSPAEAAFFGININGAGVAADARYGTNTNGILTASTMAAITADDNVSLTNYGGPTTLTNTIADLPRVAASLVVLRVA